MANKRKLKIEDDAKSDEDVDAETSFQESDDFSVEKFKRYFDFLTHVKQIASAEELQAIDKNFQRIFDNYPELYQYADVVADANLHLNLNKLYAKAVRRNFVSTDFFINAITGHMADGTRIKEFSDFPKVARRPMDIYCQDRRDEEPDGGKVRTVVFARYRQDYTKLPADQIQHYHEAADKNKEIFIKQAQEFLERHQDALLPSHVDYLSHNIKSVLKGLNKNNNGKTSKPTKRKIVEKKTAFDYFKQANAKEVEHYPEEKRVRKLQKRYNKLSTPERSIYERLAENN